MKKLGFATVLSLCLSLVGATAFLLMTPVPAAACSITVSCPGGGSVTCTGTSCGGSDGSGCSASTADGGIIFKPCSSPPPPRGDDDEEEILIEAN